MVGVPLKPIPAPVIVIPVTKPPVNVAVAVAPFPPAMATVGAVEYVVVPELIVKLAAVTPREAVAVAPEPVPMITTVGAVLKPVPLPVTATAKPAMPLPMLAAVPELLTNAPLPPTPVPLMEIGSLTFVLPPKSRVAVALTVVVPVAVVWSPPNPSDAVFPICNVPPLIAVLPV